MRRTDEKLSCLLQFCVLLLEFVYLFFLKERTRLSQLRAHTDFQFLAFMKTMRKTPCKQIGF